MKSLAAGASGLSKSKNLTSVMLACCAIGSALAFGGVEPLWFAFVEFAVLIFAAVHFWRNDWPAIPGAILCVLGIMVSIPLLQLLPLPSDLASVISPHRAALTQAILPSVAPLGPTLALSVNSHETQRALLKLVCYSLVFLLAFHSRSRKQDVLVITLLILGGFEAIYGTVQYLTGWQYIFTYAKRYYTEFGTGTYINHNHFAGLLEMVLPFALARILIRSSHHGTNRRSRWRQMIASELTSHFLMDVVLFVVLAVGLVFSISRMGIVAAALGLMLVTVIVFFQTKRRSALVIALLALGIPVWYSLWIGVTPVIGRFERLQRPPAFEIGRMPVWQDTFRLIREYPLLGTGLGTYPWASLHYQTYRLSMRYEHAHNDYLEYAADIGIPATLVLFTGLWTVVAKSAKKAMFFESRNEKILAVGCAGAMTAILAHGVADFNLQIPANALIFAWISGAAAGLVAHSRGQSSPGKISVRS